MITILTVPANDDESFSQLVVVLTVTCGAHSTGVGSSYRSTFQDLYTVIRDWALLFKLSGVVFGFFVLSKNNLLTGQTHGVTAAEVTQVFLR